MHNVVAGLNEIQHRAESTAAEYEWIDRVARSLDRSGRDTNGAVQTTLDDRNIPHRFSIARDWKVRLSGRNLDTAISEAVMFAYADGWRRAAIEVAAARARGELPPQPARAAIPEIASDQPLEDLIEEVLALASKPTAELIRTSPPGLSGHNSKVHFDFSENGMTSCRIDQSWANTVATTQLKTELNTQLALQLSAYFADRTERPPVGALTNATERLISKLQQTDTQG